MTYRGSTFAAAAAAVTAAVTAAVAAAAAVAATLVRDRTSTLRQCNILLINFISIIDIRSWIFARVVTETSPPILKYHMDYITLLLK